EERGGERRRIDRELKLRPQVDERTKVILVRVGEHEAEQVAALLHEIADVRQDKVDAGQRLVGKGDAEIDRDPLPAPLVAEAVKGEIHADLAGPAERREHEFVGGARRGGGTRGGWGGRGRGGPTTPRVRAPPP